MSFWTKIRDDIEEFFTGPVWNFIKPTVLLIESEGGQILVAAAETAVGVGFTVSGGGAAAMSAALTSFASEMTAKGLPFIESEARLLIEAALQKAKTALSPSASAPSTAP